MGGATLQLNSALYHTDTTFNAIAKALIFLEPILFFVSDPLRCTIAGVGDGNLCHTQAVRQAFIVCREETAIAGQHPRGVTETFAVLF